MAATEVDCQKQRRWNASERAQVRRNYTLDDEGDTARIDDGNQRTIGYHSSREYLAGSVSDNRSFTGAIP